MRLPGVWAHNLTLTKHPEEFVRKMIGVPPRIMKTFG